MATMHPRSWGVQTSRGISLTISLAKHRPAQGTGKAGLVTLASEPGAGSRLSLPTMGQHALEHREDVKCVEVDCSSPAMGFAGTRGSAGGADGSRQALQ